MNARPMRGNGNMTPADGASLAFGAVCREAFDVCARNALPLLKLAFLGYALAGVVGGLIGVFTTLSRQAGGAGFGGSAPALGQYVAQGVVGVVAAPLAQAAITLLALQTGNHNTPTAKTLLKNALPKLPGVVLVWLGYGAAVFVVAFMLADVLRAAQLDLSNLGRVNPSLDDVTRAVAIRVMGYNLAPDPGAPFGDALGYIRAMARRAAVAYSGSVVYYSPDHNPMALPAAGALAAWAVADVLLRLRFPALLRPRVTPWRALADSARVGLRHFGRIAVYGWALRLGFAAGMALLVWLPFTILQSVLAASVLRWVGMSWAASIASALSLVAVSLITMLFHAFGAVFDAVLWKRLTAPGCARNSCRSSFVP